LFVGFKEAVETCDGLMGQCDDLLPQLQRFVDDVRKVVLEDLAV
jgi:hypothetical protein